MRREELLQEALEQLLPIACFGADYFEQQTGKEAEDNYLVALARIKNAQNVLGVEVTV